MCDSHRDCPNGNTTAQPDVQEREESGGFLPLQASVSPSAAEGEEYVPGPVAGTQPRAPDASSEARDSWSVAEVTTPMLPGFLSPSLRPSFCPVRGAPESHSPGSFCS